ncbi:hypothetical protein KC325_g201 [Hortaea werneckii]|nr:hypothetical protein KC325_g201 [Hortaea werneckii]
MDILQVAALSLYPRNGSHITPFALASSLDPYYVPPVAGPLFLRLLDGRCAPGLNLLPVVLSTLEPSSSTRTTIHTPTAPLCPSRGVHGDTTTFAQCGFEIGADA